MVKHSSQHYIDHGVTMLLRYSLFASSLKHTNTLQISFISCTYLFLFICCHTGLPQFLSVDLEITVPMLVQIDKLVQLIESPVFTCNVFCIPLSCSNSQRIDLRLQLLEPERYPHLFKCLYGILMLLPQSLAFVSLRNRLNAVNSAGFLHIAPKS
jgi:hypothetical protein